MLATLALYVRTLVTVNVERQVQKRKMPNETRGKCHAEIMEILFIVFIPRFSVTQGDSAVPPFRVLGFPIGNDNR